mmetsp:Transcript_58921/g.124981  ORF Transcript_58921/g.124981 Transcript_58921/m.124981 type:complete len:305 (-) Transcript_58921:111-1025(-)
MGRKKHTGDGGATSSTGQDPPPSESSPSMPAGATAAAPALQALMQTNPALFMANPLMAMQMLQSGMLPAAAPVAPEPEPVKIDPDIQEMCDHFDIEDRHVKRLNEIMKKRQDTFEEDILKLWEKLRDAREPAGLLVTKMREMEEGTFIGKKKTDKYLAEMVRKYELDGMAEMRLSDILAPYDEERRTARYQELERHLEVSNKPSAMVMILLKKLSDGQPLGRAGPPAPGSYLDRKMKEQKEKDRERRDKDRDRGGDRRREDDRGDRGRSDRGRDGRDGRDGGGRGRYSERERERDPRSRSRGRR